MSVVPPSILLPSALNAENNSHPKSILKKTPQVKGSQPVSPSACLQLAEKVLKGEVISPTSKQIKLRQTSIISSKNHSLYRLTCERFSGTESSSLHHRTRQSEGKVTP